MNIVLASSSKTRKRLLDEAGITHHLVHHTFDERSINETDYQQNPERLALELAKQKALHAALPASNNRSLIIGADTIVYTPDNTIFHKPVSYDDAYQMLLQYNTTPVLVATGIAFAHRPENAQAITLLQATTTVTKIYLSLSSPFITHYLEQYKEIYQHVAGGLIIEGFGAQAIYKIEGSYTGALGLPMAETKNFLDIFTQ